MHLSRSRSLAVDVVLLWALCQLCLVSPAACAASVSPASAPPHYQVTAKRINQRQPVLSNQRAEAAFSYNYNPSYIPLFTSADAASPTQDALLVRCQNRTSASDRYAVGPSQIALVNRTGPLALDQFAFAYLSEEDVVLRPSSAVGRVHDSV
jgi:hypothetical protein